MNNKIDVNVSDEINIDCDITIGQGQKGDKGDKGDKVLLQKNETHIQYKHELSDLWTNLIPLVELKGDKGKEIELRKSPTHIQFKYIGDEEWVNLVELTLLKGDAFTYEDFTQEQLLAIKGEKGDTPSITHLEEQINTKVNEVNTLMLDVEEGEKNRDDNEDTRELQESQRINSFNDIQTNSNKKIEELNVAKNDMTNTVTNSLEDFERRFGELESANPIGEVTQSRVTIDGTVKSSLNERLTYDFNKKINSSDVYNKNETYNKKEVDNAIANVEVDLTGYATKEDLSKKSDNIYVDTQDTKVLEDAKSYVNGEIDKINNMRFVTVIELPQVGEPNTVYLLGNSTTKGNLYTEYIWINNDWEVFGGGSIDLSAYATKEELKTKSDVNHNHDSVYASKTNEHNHTNKNIIDSITTSKIESWDNKSDFDGNYDSLKGKPTIPTVDVNKAYVDSELAKKSNVHNHPYKSDTYVPTWDETIGKPSVFPPSQHNHDENYYPKDEVNSFVQTIDVEYIDSLFANSEGDASNPIDYYTKSQSDEKYATKEELKNIDIDTTNLATKVELNEVKQSVSNGKVLIASAITDKGVSTSNEDSFQTMAKNISNIINDNNNKPIISDLTYEGMQQNTVTLRFKTIDLEGDSLTFKLKLNELEYVDINPTLEDGFFTYKIINLIKNTSYVGFIKAIDGHNGEAIKEISFKTNDSIVYGVAVDETNSNPETCVTYIDDAVGIQPATQTGYGGWEDKYPFNKIRPCGIKDSKFYKYVDKNNFLLFEDGTATQKTVYDIMIEFPKIYWKFTKTKNGYELRISEDKVDDDYVCLAHTIGDKEVDNIYISAYLGTVIDNKIHSYPGQYVNIGYATPTWRRFAENNGTGYHLLNYTSVLMLQILYLIMYKNLDSQTALGKGFTVMGDKTYTGGTSDKGMIFGEDTGKKQMKFLGIEDVWGNIDQMLDGIFMDANGKLLISDNTVFNEDGTGYKEMNNGTPLDNMYGYADKVKATNEMGFIGNSAKASSSTYYCDTVSLSKGKIGGCGGGYNSYDGGGIFRISLFITPGSNAGQGVRTVFWEVK